MWLNMGLDPQFHRPEFTGKKKARLSQNALEDHGYVWHTYEKHREETPFAVDQILEAVGLNKLPCTAQRVKSKESLESTL